MIVCVAMAHDIGYSELASITVPTWQRYCAKWGYHFHYDAQRPKEECDFAKVAMYQQLYASYGREDVFVWADSDALIMNSAIRLDHIVYAHMPKSCHFLIGQDMNGLNSGVYFARFTPQGRNFLRVAMIASKSMGWADQEGLIQKSLTGQHRSGYKEVPGKIFNAMLYDRLGWDDEDGNYLNKYEHGDLVLHFAGLPMHDVCFCGHSSHDAICVAIRDGNPCGCDSLDAVSSPGRVTLARAYSRVAE